MYSLDANHYELTQAAEHLGFIVIDNARVKRLEPGQLDCWWGIPNPTGGPGVWVWVEYKTAAGQLRAAQVDTVQTCAAAGLPVEVVRTIDDVIAVYHKYMGG